MWIQAGLTACLRLAELQPTYLLHGMAVDAEHIIVHDDKAALSRQCGVEAEPAWERIWHNPAQQALPGTVKGSALIRACTCACMPMHMRMHVNAHARVLPSSKLRIHNVGCLHHNHTVNTAAACGIWRFILAMGRKPCWQD